jgi:putative hydrolase of the HAD superfamily
MATRSSVTFNQLLPEITMIQAITLDAAGTLIYPREKVGDTYCRIAAEFGAKLDAQALGLAFGEVFADMPPMAFASTSAADLDQQERAWWSGLVRQVTDRAGGVEQFSSYFTALYEYFAEPSAWELYAEVMPLLQHCRERQLATAVVSNFDSRLLNVLAGLGVSSKVDAIVFSTGANSAKPDGGIFTQALKQLNIVPADALHVGDDVDADYHGARAAGLHALIVHRGSTTTAPDVPHIADLQQLWGCL